jgi:hypothetical protein
MIENGSGNTYMGRTNIVANPEKILSLLLLIDNLNNLPYKGEFTSDGTAYDLVEA